MYRDVELGREVRREDLLPLVSDLVGSDGLKRRRARAELIRIGGPAVRFLHRLLEDDRWRVRWEAAKALGAIADPASAGPLTARLDDPNSSVRWLAAEALVRLGPCCVEALLHELVRCERSPRFRHAAHHVLSGIEDEAARRIVAPVVKALAADEVSGGVILSAHRCLEHLHALCPES